MRDMSGLLMVIIVVILDEITDGFLRSSFYETLPTHVMKNEIDLS
jgi:hypothetical protein